MQVKDEFVKYLKQQIEWHAGEIDKIELVKSHHAGSIAALTDALITFDLKTQEAFEKANATPFWSPPSPPKMFDVGIRCPKCGHLLSNPLNLSQVHCPICKEDVTPQRGRDTEAVAKGK